ncbi:ParB/RepB/Spo0J family partition protein [Stagnihabitans tardus]|uniref:ParB N-terminal domain-containing protein n=1 Tax=Stagnihabitans tardus TaxID=2699202 RepID=A0AAE4Y680_9RHOB|nr:ParB N-terminal domain-containing protein [Stagnihabitans tardus]NBZ86581.1 ParB N-terminal domain-containing protein [Stagnihabitans tardus]
MQLIPLSAIDATALPRDRLALAPEALDALFLSILREGLRQPIEVYRTETGYALISGLRRLTACQRLHALRQSPDSALIPAFIREPADIPEALASMVSENEIRAEVSPWEKANLITECVCQGHFPNNEAAVAALFRDISPSARSRLLSVVSVYEELGPRLTNGEGYSLRQLLRMAMAIKAGFGEVMETALRENHGREASVQWELLQNILTEAEQSLKDPEPSPLSRPPRRILRPRKGLTVRREWLPNGWRLVFTGEEAQGMMIEQVLSDIERMYGPG